MKKVSLIIPIYNEEDHLQKFLSVIDVLDIGAPKELVFIDDCSRDASREILKGFSFQSEVQMLFQEVNRGKGAALARGIAEATGDIIGIQDADFEYDTNDIPKLIVPLLEERADVVYGSRFSRSSNQVHRTFHYLVNRFLTLVSNLLSGLYVSDMETCYKFFAADVIKHIVLESPRFGFEPEVTAKIGKLKVRVMEFPISYFPRNYMEGKKITWKDGVAALRHLFYFNLVRGFAGSFRKTLPDKYVPKGQHWL